MKNFNIRNPLSIIAMFCTITEGLCLYALPKLTSDNQNIFIWFIIFFPIILLILFFFTLIKHHTKLYSPSDFETKDNSFVEIFYGKTFSKKELNVNQVSQSAISNSFTPFEITEKDKENEKKSIELANNILKKLDSVLPKHKLSRVYYKQFNSISYLIDIEINDEYLVDEKEKIQPFILLNWEMDDKIQPVIVGSGFDDTGNGDLTINYILNTITSCIKNNIN